MYITGTCYHVRHPTAKTLSASLAAYNSRNRLYLATDKPTASISMKACNNACVIKAKKSGDSNNIQRLSINIRCDYHKHRHLTETMPVSRYSSYPFSQEFSRAKTTNCDIATQLQLARQAVIATAGNRTS
jgi:hypothetical protein